MVKPKSRYKRFSITMPFDLCEELDSMAEAKGMDNRSMAIAELVKHELISYKQEELSRVMAGTLTLSYDAETDECANRLSRLRRKWLAEVISTIQVMLEDGMNMEIWIVQGEVGKLHRLKQDACSCSKSCMAQLTFAEALLPPLQFNKTSRKGN